MASQIDNITLNDDTTGLTRTVDVASDDLVLSVDLTLQSGAVFQSDNVKRGSGDPNGSVSGNEGDLYQRTDAASGSLYVNTDGTNTGWSLVFAGGAPPLSSVLSTGNFTGGTDLEISNGDSIVGENPGGPIFITAGSNTGFGGSGGAITITAGAGGVTGLSGDLVLATQGLPAEPGDISLNSSGAVLINPAFDSTAQVNGSSVLQFNERSSLAGVPVITAGQGRIWVRDDTPNVLIYTDDTATDWVLNATSGDVTGPASSTDNALVRFDGATGKLVQNSGVTLSDGNAMAGAASYNGVVIESHASRHLPGGADALTTAAPSATAVQVGNAAATGSAASFSRSDHVHAVAAGTPVNVTKSANAAGAAVTFARSDHKHDVTTAAAVSASVGQANAEGTSTSLARADHTHAHAAGTPVNVTKAANSAGAATTFSRSDHKHDVTTAAAISVGTTNAEGSATSLARSDHTHAVTGFSISGQAQGDVLYFNGTSWVRLAPGTAGQVLTTQGAAANPTWSSPKRYPNSGTNPVSPTPAAGDTYYNTTLQMDMVYDGARSKWLSVTSDVLWGSDAGALTVGTFLQAGNVRMTAAFGYTAMYNGTVVGLGYTRSDSDASSWQVTSNGSTISTIATSATVGQSNTLNDNFNQGSVLGIRNGGANSMSNTIVWVRVRWRI